MNINNISSNERIALSKFLGIYFLGDFLENQSDINEALDDYLNSEDDPDGSELMAGVSKLRNAPDYSEKEMVDLVERQWKGNGVAEIMGFTYKDTLDKLAEALAKRFDVDDSVEARPDVFIGLVNKYAPALGEEQALMMRENYQHGEGQIAFETLVNSLAEMDVEVSPADRHELSVIAEAYGLWNYPSGKGTYW